MFTYLRTPPLQTATANPSRAEMLSSRLLKTHFVHVISWLVGLLRPVNPMGPSHGEQRLVLDHTCQNHIKERTKTHTLKAHQDEQKHIL